MSEMKDPSQEKGSPVHHPCMFEGAPSEGAASPEVAPEEHGTQEVVEILREPLGNVQVRRVGVLPQRSEAAEEVLNVQQVHGPDAVRLGGGVCWKEEAAGVDLAAGISKPNVGPGAGGTPWAGDFAEDVDRVLADGAAVSVRVEDVRVR